MLPTNFRKSQVFNTPPNCPICDYTREDQEHVFNCELNYDRLRTVNLQKALHKCNTAPSICKYFEMVLIPGYYHQQIDTNNPLVLEAIKEQTNIGISQVFYGKISHKWKDVQKEYTNYTNNPSNFSIDTWATNILLAICKHQYEVWTKRNQHNSENNNIISSSNPNIINSKIDTLHRQVRKSVLPIDSSLFNTPIDILKKKRLNTRVKWCESVEAAIKFYENNRRIITNNSRKITDYYSL